MESQSGSGSSIHHRSTLPSTNSSESEPFNSENKQELSHDHDHDHIHFMPNATITTTTPHSENSSFLHINDQKNPSMMEKSDESSINSHLETNHANPFGEFHHHYPHNSDSSFSSSQNPFLLLGDHDDANESQQLHGQVPFETSFHQPSTYESSLGNPFHELTTSTTNDSHTFVEHHDNEWHHEDHWNFSSDEDEETTHASSSSQLFHPLFTLESTQNQQVDNANHKNHKGSESSTQQNMHDSHSTGFGSSTPQHVHDSHSIGFESSTQQHMHNSSLSASSNTEKDTHVHRKSGKDITLPSESSDDDMPVRSMPKHEQKSPAVAIVPETIQNPPIQIMERQENSSATSSSTPSSTPRLPLHAFAKDRLNAQWSSTSNESLFSIQMGNTSFSNDMAWLSKSDELDKHVDHMNNMSGVGVIQSNHSPLLPQTQATKFNDISPNYAEQHENSLKVTEAKAAETMREVIMETSETPENNKSKGSTTFFNAAMHSNTHSSSNNDHSRHSNGSTQSFAFKSYADGDKTLSSKHGEETKKPLKQSVQQNVKATATAPSAAQNTKPTSNASQNRWLSCFTCCH